MKLPSTREIATEAKLLLVGVAALIWTCRRWVSLMKRLSR